MHHCFLCVAKVRRKDGCLWTRSQSMFDSVCKFACCWCSLSHKFPSWVLEWATMFQSKRMIQHNWFGTRSSRTSQEGWCFLRMCEWFEDGIYTLGKLQQYLKDISEGDDNTYHTSWIKSKIIERYGKEHVIFTEICGRRDVVCFCKFCKKASVKWLTTS